MHGFINIDKPLGITSHDVVARVRRITKIRRVGHAGTLDPNASGVLILALGQATRLIEYVQDETRKTYIATMRFGERTSTDDSEGTVVATAPIPASSDALSAAIIQTFQGTIMQVPPQVSALHHEGQRMYDLARQGKAPELPPRPVEIYALQIIDWQDDIMRIEVTCGKGTYIRALARDIGQFLQSEAHLIGLRRTAVGTFAVADSVTLDTLEQAPWQSQVQPPLRAVADWPQYALDDAEMARIRNGLAITPRHPIDAPRVALCDMNATLIAVAHTRQHELAPVKVFTWEQ